MCPLSYRSKFLYAHISKSCAIDKTHKNYRVYDDNLYRHVKFPSSDSWRRFCSMSLILSKMSIINWSIENIMICSFPEFDANIIFFLENVSLWWKNNITIANVQWTVCQSMTWTKFNRHHVLMRCLQSKQTPFFSVLHEKVVKSCCFMINWWVFIHVIN